MTMPQTPPPHQNHTNVSMSGRQAFKTGCMVGLGLFFAGILVFALVFGGCAACTVGTIGIAAVEAEKAAKANADKMTGALPEKPPLSEPNVSEFDPDPLAGTTVDHGKIEFINNANMLRIGQQYYPLAAIQQLADSGNLGVVANTYFPNANMTTSSLHAVRCPKLTGNNFVVPVDIKAYYMGTQDMGLTTMYCGECLKITQQNLVDGKYKIEITELIK